MKKILLIIAMLMLVACSRQELPHEVDPQVKAPSAGPERFIDQEHGVVCYSYSFKSVYPISCVKL